MNKRKEGTWASELSFEEIVKIIESEWEEVKATIYRRKEVGLPYKRLLKRMAYLSVLLIQIRNGCRVGEAVEALKRFVSTKNQVVYVRVEKKWKKDKETGETILLNIKRRIVRPAKLTDDDLDLISGVEVKKQNVVSWASSRLGINTHAIRHAFITNAAKRGINPSLIAKIIKWNDLQVLLEYIREEEADELLDQLDIL